MPAGSRPASHATRCTPAVTGPSTSVATRRPEHSRVKRPIHGDQNDRENDGNRQVYGRPPDRNPEFLHGLGRDSLKSSQPTDGIQRYTSRTYSEPTGREGVPQLVKDDTPKHTKDETHSRQRRPNTLALNIVKRKYGGD